MTGKSPAKKFADRATKELLEYHDVDIVNVISIDEKSCDFDVLEDGYDDEPTRIRALLDKTSNVIGFWYK